MQKTVDTPYGETTIEVVECDSCGNTVSKDDTVEFTLGDREGRACEHCYDSGPVSFPEGVLKKRDFSRRLGISYILLFPIFLIPTLSGSIRGDKKHSYVMLGIIATLVWVVLPLVILLH